VTVSLPAISTAKGIETATLYELTDLGRSLDAPLAAMTERAGRNWQTVEAVPSRCDRRRRASG
jgi:DNA-binding HxlR family transcriptional regulator